MRTLFISQVRYVLKVIPVAPTACYVQATNRSFK